MTLETPEDTALNRHRPRGSTVIPCLRYVDALAAINWLCEVIGFTRHSVHIDDSGRVAHAQLTLGSGMVMLGSTDTASEWGQFIRQPNEEGATDGICIVVQDADLIHSRAIATNTRILIPLRDESYGGRGFTFADPESHIWSVTTYDPWSPT